MCLKSKAIFLDRDGTINEDYGYVYKLSDLKLIEGVTKEVLSEIYNVDFEIMNIQGRPLSIYY